MEVKGALVKIDIGQESALLERPKLVHNAFYLRLWFYFTSVASGQGVGPT